MTDKIKDATEFDYPDAIEVLYKMVAVLDVSEDASNDLLDTLDTTYAQVLMLATTGKLDRSDLIEAHNDAVKQLIAVHNASNQASVMIQHLIGIVNECADKAPEFKMVM